MNSTPIHKRFFSRKIGYDQDKSANFISINERRLYTSPIPEDASKWMILRRDTEGTDSSWSKSNFR